MYKEMDIDDKASWERLANLKDNILLFLYQQMGNSISYTDIRNHVLNKPDTQPVVIDNNNQIVQEAVTALKDFDLVEVTGNYVTLSIISRKFFKVGLKHKYFNKPFTRFIEKERIRIDAEDKDNWRKVNWLKITIISSILTLIAGLLSGMCLEKWKLQNQKEMNSKIITKPLDQKLSTKS